MTSRTPAALAQAQLDAYNDHDADAFAACYAEDVVVARHPTGEVICEGRPALHALYADLFERKPDLRVELLARLPCGDFVVDHERVLAGGDEPERFAVAIYECGDDVIRRVWFLPVADAD